MAQPLENTGAGDGTRTRDLRRDRPNEQADSSTKVGNAAAQERAVNAPDSQPTYAPPTVADRYGAGVDPAGWRPIATAPRDGTEVWLDHTLSNGDYACKGRWSGEQWSVPNYFIGTIKGRGPVMLKQPDVWQPLPTPGGSDGR